MFMIKHACMHAYMSYMYEIHCKCVQVLKGVARKLSQLHILVCLVHVHHIGMGSISGKYECH